MRVLVIAALLVPLSAAVSSLRCVNDCVAVKLSLIESIFDALERHPRQQPNVTLQHVCKLSEKSVQCLEKCEASDQQAYFLGVTDKWHQLLCNQTEEELQRDLGFFEYAADCLSRRDEKIMVGAVVALFIKGGNPTFSEAVNLCELASGIARGSIRKGCGPHADLLVVEFFEYAYRFLALKLGMEDLPEKCRNFEHAMATPATIGDLIGEFIGRGEKEISEKDHSTFCMQGCLRQQAIDFILATDDDVPPCRAFKPIVECFRKCPLNKLAGMAVDADDLFCNPEAEEYVHSQIDICAEKHAKLPNGLQQTSAIVKKILSSGANPKASSADNLCQVFRAVADPTVQPFKTAAAKLNGTEAQESCQVAYDAVSTVFSLPLRVAALKLGISQEDISCGDY